MLLVGLLYADDAWARTALEGLSGRFGQMDYLSAVSPFAYTDFYAAEMGANLARRHAVFHDLVDPGALAEIKLWTNGLETSLAGPAGRRVNVDPGLLSPLSLVLASGKPAAHRVYLSRGIWAEPTLVFEKGGYLPLKWTYPDYAAPAFREALAPLRQRYLMRTKETKCSEA